MNRGSWSETWLEAWNAWYFAEPQWFWLLLIWPLAQLFLRVWRALRAKFLPAKLNLKAGEQAVFFHPLIAKFVQDQRKSQQISAISKQPGLVIQYLADSLKLVILLLLLASLAQPQIRLEQPSQIQVQAARDIALVVESSVSMVLRDYQIAGEPAQRIEVVKQVLDDFVKKLTGDSGATESTKFSLFLYAEQAFNLVPLTADSQVLRFELQRLQPYLAGRTDQAMGAGIGLALRDLIADSSQPGKSQKTKSQLVVLVSDGLQTASELDLHQVASLARQQNIPIFTIGIGANSASANQTATSGLLYQQLETESLQMLAQRTGGKFFQVGGGEDLSQVLAQINQISALKTAEQAEVASENWQLQALYFWPLSWALALLLAWWALTAGGRKWNR